MDDRFLNAYHWGLKYIVLFRVIAEDEELSGFFSGYNVYDPPQGFHGIYKILHECMEEAYDNDVVITNYSQVIEENGICESNIVKPSEEWVLSLAEEQILACIAWHFRRDHFNEGSWISESVAKGSMKVLVNAFLEKCKGIKEFSE